MVWITTQDKQKHPVLPLHCVPQQQLAAANTETFLEHASELNFNSEASSVRISSIVCTIGPACFDAKTIENMIESGMNIACLNFAHGLHNYHAEAIKNIRIAAEIYSKKNAARCPVAIALDLKGPMIRTGFPLGGRCVQVELKKGETIRLTTDSDYVEKGSSSILFIDYESIHKVVQIGSKITLDDGRISMVCTGIEDFDVICTIENGGFIGSRRRVQLHGVSVDLPPLSKKDKADLLFAVQQDVDMIFASFVRSAAAVKEIRELLRKLDSNIMIISKIQNEEALQNIDEIIMASDGVMVARGYLGIEIPADQMFLVQKSLISKCNKAGKPVICRTNMLESMVKHSEPTRAESSDVANAILDGADCVMLCSETAKGNYPIEAIRTMASICKESEAAIWWKELFTTLLNEVLPPVDSAQAIAIATVDISVKSGASAIVVVTNTFRSAKLISKFRPRCPIIAVTRDAAAARRAHLYRGILPLVYKVDRAAEWHKDLNSRAYYGINFGRRKGFIKAGEAVILLTASRQGIGFTDQMRIIFVSKRISHRTVCVC